MVDNRPIKEMTRPEVKTELSRLILDAYKCCGQDLKPEDLKFTTEKVFQNISFRYGSLSILDLKAVFQLGISETYGKFSRVTVKALNSWFRQYFENWQIQNQRAIRQKEAIAVSKNSAGLGANPVLAEAVAWKIKNVPKELWDDIKGKEIARCLEQGERPEKLLLPYTVNL